MTVEIFNKVTILQSEISKESNSLIYYPAIASDSKNKQRIESSKKNIKQYYHSKEPLEEEIDNQPFDNVRYIGHGWKDVGNGTSYKVMLPSKQVVDLSEEMMHVILTTIGISEGGILNGEYVFGKVNSDTTLILVGSNFYNSGMEEKKFKTKESAVTNPVIGKIFGSFTFKYDFTTFLPKTITNCLNTICPADAFANFCNQIKREGSSQHFFQQQFLHFSL